MKRFSTTASIEVIHQKRLLIVCMFLKFLTNDFQPVGIGIQFASNQGMPRSVAKGTIRVTLSFRFDVAEHVDFADEVRESRINNTLSSLWKKVCGYIIILPQRHRKAAFFRIWYQAAVSSPAGAIIFHQSGHRHWEENPVTGGRESHFILGYRREQNIR